MKRFIAALAASFVLLTSHQVTYGANTATEQSSLPIYVGGAGPVRPVVVAIDTTGADLTINDPPAGKMACIMGMAVSDGTAANLTIKSGSTSNVVLELAANQGILKPIGNEAMFCTQPGADLIIQSSAAITSMLMYVVETSFMNLTGR